MNLPISSFLQQGMFWSEVIVPRRYDSLVDRLHVLAVAAVSEFDGSEFSPTGVVLFKQRVSKRVGHFTPCRA